MSIFGIFKSRGLKIPKAPHEIFPEILHWKIGDSLSNCGDRRYAFYAYEGTNESGDVFYSYYDGTKYIMPIKAARSFINCSLLDRGISEEKQSTGEYMQLMEDFQKAYKEISQ